MNVADAIAQAASLLHLQPATSGTDPRWQAIIEVGEHIEDSPEDVWQFIEHARSGADEDLEAALVTVLLEHLVEEHEAYARKAREVANDDPQMRRMLDSCW